MIHYDNLDRKNLYRLAKFVVEENYSHHEFIQPKQLKNEIDLVFSEEQALQNSKIFIAADSKDEIIGSIRVLRWNFSDLLPIEKIFHISPLSLDTPCKVFHIGRFAIKKGSDKSGFMVFKTLMALAINEVCRNENTFALAECDAKLLKILRLLDIEAKILAKSQYYLGSETIPVLLPYNGLKRFLEKNRILISDKSSNLHFSVDLNESLQTYTVV